jgi:hypothetical protein
MPKGSNVKFWCLPEETFFSIGPWPTLTGKTVTEVKHLQHTIGKTVTDEGCAAFRQATADKLTAGMERERLLQDALHEERAEKLSFKLVTQRQRISTKVLAAAFFLRNGQLKRTMKAERVRYVSELATLHKRFLLVLSGRFQVAAWLFEFSFPFRMG